MPALTPISKDEAAISQLDVALRLFLASEELASAVTLAGAAEEILGKLAIERGHTPALESDIQSRLKLHAEIYAEQAHGKSYAKILNEPRNELKHMGTGKAITSDLEVAAAQMIDRALRNYRLVFGVFHPKEREFELRCGRLFRAKGWIG